MRTEIPHKLKPRPNDRNMSTQHIATLLGATCCVRLATVLRHVGCRCWLKFETGGQTRATMLRYVVLVCCARLAGALKFVFLFHLLFLHAENVFNAGSH